MVSFEWSFNKSFENYDRIVRVLSQEYEGDLVDHTPGNPIPAMAAMETSISQFEKTSRVRETYNSITIADQEGGTPIKKFNPDGTALFAQPSFFEIFDFPVLSGDLSTALNEPNSIILTKTWAEKCFENWEKAQGQTVLLDNIYPLTVTAVLEDLDPARDFNFPYLLSYKTIEGKEDYLFYNRESWGSCSSNDQFYALLASPDQLEEAAMQVGKIGEERIQGKRRQTRSSAYHASFGGYAF